MHVEVGNAILHVYDKKNDVGLLGCKDNLFTNLFLKNIVAVNNPASCIHYRKLTSNPFRLAILTVACCSGLVADDCLARFSQTVEQCRLAYIRTTYYSNQISHKLS